MALDTPSTPEVWSVNADTIMVTADDIDDDATHVDVYVTRVLPTAGSPFLAAHVEKADLPVEITDLELGIPRVQFSVVVRAWSATDESADSAPVTIYMPRLYVFGHVDISAVGVTGVEVDVGYQPDSGRLFPASLIDIPPGLRSFDASPVLYRGPQMSAAVEVARMVVQMDTMPDPKIRNGDRLSMVCRKDLGAGRGRWTPIFYDALVREDDPTWAEEGSFTDRYFDNNYLDPAFFQDGYFA